MYYPRIVKNWGVGKFLKGICLTALSPLPVPLTPCYMTFRICKCQYSIKHKYYNVIQLLTDLRCIFLNIRYIFLIIKFYRQLFIWRWWVLNLHYHWPELHASAFSPVPRWSHIMVYNIYSMYRTHFSYLPLLPPALFAFGQPPRRRLSLVFT